MIRKGGRYPRGIRKGGREVQVLLKGGRPIWMSPAAQRKVIKTWLDVNVTTAVVVVLESEAFWLELEIILPGDFDGNPVDGWVGEMVAGKPPITLGLFYSTDLSTWTDGGWIAAPGKTTETLGDGRKKWFARYDACPVYWVEVLVELAATTDLYGKSITDISVLGVSESLPNFPYAMPADASTLQTDLVAAGYTGATVTSSTGSLTATARNYTAAGAAAMAITQSGSNVTGVSIGGSAITSGMSYPYSMPSQRATLQADLRTAGHTGAVVILHQDTWSITLPTVVASGNLRPFVISYTPGDPWKAWDFFGTYLGEVPAITIDGTSGNVRDIYGGPLVEANRAFARIGVIHPPP